MFDIIRVFLFCYFAISTLLCLYHTIYIMITHILSWVLFREKTLAITFVRDCHTHNPLHNPLWFFSTPTSPCPNPWKVDSSNTYHIEPKCKVRFWCCWEALEEAICLVDAIELNYVIRRAREDKVSSSQLVARPWRAQVHGID